MTLQERVLEAVGRHGMASRFLYARLSGDSAAAVDAAIQGLLKEKRLEMRAGVYIRVGAETAAGSLANATASTDEPLRKCVRCGEPKPLKSFGLKSTTTGARLRTCGECLNRVAVLRSGDVPLPRKKPQEPAGASGVATNGAATNGAATRHAFSPGLVLRLIAWQKAKAEELQAACEGVSALRQELADIEELVRAMTAKERGKTHEAAG